MGQAQQLRCGHIAALLDSGLLTSDTSGILTTDYPLAQVGRLRNIQVLNLSELMVALRPDAQPGGQKSVHSEAGAPGQRTGQAIAYPVLTLEDGTMVMDGAKALSGHSRNLIITGALETNSGRMVFGQLSPEAGSPGTNQPPPRPGNRGGPT